MTILLQLSPSIPVIVTSKENRAGEAMFLMDRSPEHHCYWGVVLDDTGEIWWVPNNEVRVMHCWTTARPPRVQPDIKAQFQKGWPSNA